MIQMLRSPLRLIVGPLASRSSRYTRHKLNRGKLALFIAKLPCCLIAMEACPGSQHLARAFQRHGHDVRLIAPKFIKPYLKGQKNDFNDAAAIAEAVSRPTMRFVTIKSNEQLDMQAVHRIRDRLIGQRTAVINQIRAFLLEYGLPVKEGRPSLSGSLPDILEDATNGLSDRMRQLLAQLREHWGAAGRPGSGSAQVSRRCACNSADRSGNSKPSSTSWRRC